jgi:GxxExxY protein
LQKLGLSFKRQVALPLTYDGRLFPRAFVADLIVENQVLVEFKAIDRILPVHCAQIRTYLRIADIEKGLLINFNVVRLKHGIRSFLRGDIGRGSRIVMP